MSATYPENLRQEVERYLEVMRFSEEALTAGLEEAVESAKTFCGSEAPGFVNGVLGAVLRELRENAQIP